jgi:hypothetical protein
MGIERKSTASNVGICKKVFFQPDQEEGRENISETTRIKTITDKTHPTLLRKNA